jgi:hypothetical protein
VVEFGFSKAVTGEAASTVLKSTKGRLVYKRVSDASLKGRFDIAPPGGEFKTYRSWTMHRD